MARTLWKGAISFGLVTIPVRMYSAVSDKSPHFNLLTKDGKCRLRRKLVCPTTGDEVPYEETARGFEIAPDQYVLVQDEEIEKIKPKSGRSIEILSFVSLSDIDVNYYDKPYYLGPDERGTKAYALLIRVMREAGMVAIAKFILREKEYLAVLRPTESILVLETMRYADELVDPHSIIEADVVEGVEVSDKELKMAHQLIETMKAPFNPDQYHDDFHDRIMELVERKAQGKEIITHEEQPPEGGARVLNLMEALEKTLSQKRKSSSGTEKKERRKKTGKRSA